MKREDLPANVEELQALVLQTSGELQQVRDEADQAQRQLKLAEQQAVELSATVAEQRQTIEKQEQTIADLLDAMRGKQRERIDPDQILLFDIGELETFLKETRESQPAPGRQRRRHGRRVLPDNLPQEEVLHELPEEERLCPHDGQPMRFIRYEISKQLEYEPAKLKVLVHKRAVYTCATKHDEATLVTAPKPPQPIDKGLPGPGLIAALGLGKFGDHLPGYRLEDILSRHGVDIRRSTIYDWLAAAADLAQPLVALMTERVLQSKVIHTDDTNVKLIDRSLRGTRLARFWAYVGMRTAHAAPLLADLKTWLDDQPMLPKSRIGQAATYTRNQWDALNRYLEDGDLSIDNNISERCVKPVAIGRKNWLFVGSVPAGRRAAILMSLIASCKDNRAEPWAYLRDLFDKLPQGVDLETLLPDRWLQANLQHRWTIADQRAEERVAKGNL